MFESRYESKSFYCIFCSAGKEAHVIKMLTLQRYKGFAPLQTRRIIKNGIESVQKKHLLPGYVFFEAETEPDWDVIININGILRILQYDDGSRMLCGKDEEFVHWLQQYNGVIDVSRVIREGEHIRIVDGPLKNYEGNIIRVNRKRGCVEIQIGESECLKSVWCPIEYME